MMLLPTFAAPPAPADTEVPGSILEAFVDVLDGISEGGKIIIALLFVLGLGIFFFGRVLARKLDVNITEAIDARKQATAAQREAAAAREGINNSHPTHVRDDIDAIKAAVDAGFRELKTDIGGIRSEIREDRRKVNRLEERLTEHIEAK